MHTAEAWLGWVVLGCKDLALWPGHQLACAHTQALRQQNHIGKRQTARKMHCATHPAKFAHMLCALTSYVTVLCCCHNTHVLQAYRQLFIITCSQLQSIDGQPVTADERDILLSTAAVDSPRGPADMPQYTAAMLLAAAAAASAGDTRTAAAGLPLGRLAAAGCGSDMLGSPKAQGFNPQGFSSPGLLPTMVNFEGLANLTTARQNLLALGATASGLPGMMPASVPSIQSGVLVLTGPASFGLEGTSMRGSSSSSPGAGSGIAGAGASPHPSPSKLASKQQQQQSSPGGGAGRGSSRRTTTGSIASYRAGGFVVRQATFQY
jgi:hypothetical protein